MKILKFFLEAGIPPEPGTISFVDHVGFNDTLNLNQIATITFQEAVAFHDFIQTVCDLEFTDEAGFDDLFQLAHELTFTDEFGIDDYFYFPDLMDMEDGIGFTDDLTPPIIDWNLSFTDSVGFDDSTSSLFRISNYLVTWRCRTRTPKWGYGGAPYGDSVSYGDGTTDDIVGYVLDYGYIDTSNVFHSLLGTPVQISIVDTSDPDADAHYLYTMDSSFKFTNDNLTFRVWQKDSNDILSPARDIQVVPISFE